MNRPLLPALTLAVLVLAAGCSSGGSEGMEGADLTGATNKPTPIPSSVPKDAAQRGSGRGAETGANSGRK